MAKYRRSAIAAVAVVVAAAAVLAVVLVSSEQGASALLGRVPRGWTPRMLGESKVLTPGELNALHPDAHHAPAHPFPAAEHKPYHAAALTPAQIAALHGQTVSQQRPEKQAAPAPQAAARPVSAFNQRELGALLGKVLTKKVAPRPKSAAPAGFTQVELDSLHGLKTMDTNVPFSALHQKRAAASKPSRVSKMVAAAHAHALAAKASMAEQQAAPNKAAPRAARGAKAASVQVKQEEKKEEAPAKKAANKLPTVFKTPFLKDHAAAPAAAPEAIPHARSAPTVAEPSLVLSTPFGKARAAEAVKEEEAAPQVVHSTPFKKARKEVKREVRLAAKTGKAKDAMLQRLKVSALPATQNLNPKP